jgi:hypothetical protein
MKFESLKIEAVKIEAVKYGENKGKIITEINQ